MSESKGRFQYIKRGIVGMAAATLLTGVVAAPAFAADAAVDTLVKLNTTDVAQISVTGPTTPVVGKVDNTGTMTFASNYSFTNNSLLGVKISNLKVVPAANTPFALVDESAYGGPSVGNNAVNLKAKLGSMANALDLASFVGDSGAAVSDAPTINATDGSMPLTFDGQMKNFTSQGVGNDLALATLTWTVTVA